jgi:hypothetical protein
MKKQILEILAFIIAIFTLGYLLTSFINMSLNPNDWGIDIRGTFIAITSVICFFTIFGYSITKM